MAGSPKPEAGGARRLIDPAPIVIPGRPRRFARKTSAAPWFCRADRDRDGRARLQLLPHECGVDQPGGAQSFESRAGACTLAP
jgi:hypothetical protein